MMEKEDMRVSQKYSLSEQLLICSTLLRVTIGRGIRSSIVTLLVHGIFAIIEPFSLSPLTLTPVLACANGYYLVFAVAGVNV